MAANVLKNHNVNPYSSSKTKQDIILFTGTGETYYSSLLYRCVSSIALRVMIALVCKLNSEGYACATLDDLARMLQRPRSYINGGILELARFNLISKKKRGEYWIKPELFRPAVLQV